MQPARARAMLTDMSAPTLVLLAHPELRHSRMCRALAQIARTLPEVEVRDLYALWPDFVIDVEAERAALAPARRLVWLHPVLWYSMPPLMKLWLDKVLVRGWAHGEGGTALQGKELHPVLSTHSRAEDFRVGGRHGRDFADFLPPYERIAALCGLRWQAPLVLHRAGPAQGEGPSDDQVRAFVERLSAPLPPHPEGG